MAKEEENLLMDISEFIRKAKEVTNCNSTDITEISGEFMKQRMKFLTWKNNGKFPTAIRLGIDKKKDERILYTPQALNPYFLPDIELDSVISFWDCEKNGKKNFLLYQFHVNDFEKSEIVAQITDFFAIGLNIFREGETKCKIKVCDGNPDDVKYQVRENKILNQKQAMVRENFLKFALVSIVLRRVRETLNHRGIQALSVSLLTAFLSVGVAKVVFTNYDAKSEDGQIPISRVRSDTLAPTQTIQHQPLVEDMIEVAPQEALAFKSSDQGDVQKTVYTEPNLPNGKNTRLREASKHLETIRDQLKETNSALEKTNEKLEAATNQMERAKNEIQETNREFAQIRFKLDQLKSTQQQLELIKIQFESIKTQLEVVCNDPDILSVDTAYSSEAKKACMNPVFRTIIADSSKMGWEGLSERNDQSGENNNKHDTAPDEKATCGN